MSPEEAVATKPTWPPEWARSVAFLTGIGLIVWETIFDHVAHLIVFGPAFALTGLPLAKGIETVLDKLPSAKVK